MALRRGGEIGKRCGLKNRCPQGLEGSSPSPGTPQRMAGREKYNRRAMKDIGGKVAVVTGASRGLGRAIAQTLFDHGMKVVVSARGAEELESFRKQLDRSGSASLAVPADVTSGSDRADLVASAKGKFGTIDVLVNNAGTDHPGLFVDEDFEDVRRMVDLTLVSVMGLTQLVLPEMLERRAGHIVNISSMSGLAPVPYATTYSATKAALIVLRPARRIDG